MNIYRVSPLHSLPEKIKKLAYKFSNFKLISFKGFQITVTVHDFNFQGISLLRKFNMFNFYANFF